MRSPVIFALLLAVVPGLAHAGFDEEKSQCLAGDEVPAVVINSCTQILETGDLDDTDLAVAYTNRGWAFAQSSLVEQGTEDFGKAIRHKPNFAKPYQLRGAYRLVNGEFKKAIQDLDQAIRLDPRDADSFVNRAKANYASENYLLVVGDLDKALELDPNNADALLNRGMAHYVTNNSDKAIADFSSLIEIDPDHKDAYAFRGIVYEFERKLNLAKRDFQKAYDLGLRSPLIQDYVQKYDLRK